MKNCDAFREHLSTFTLQTNQATVASVLPNTFQSNVILRKGFPDFSGLVPYPTLLDTTQHKSAHIFAGTSVCQTLSQR